jgi:hypothetical protein
MLCGRYHGAIATDNRIYLFLKELHIYKGLTGAPLHKIITEADKLEDLYQMAINSQSLALASRILQGIH